MADIIIYFLRFYNIRVIDSSSSIITRDLFYMRIRIYLILKYVLHIYMALKMHTNPFMTLAQWIQKKRNPCSRSTVATADTLFIIIVETIIL